MVKYTILPKVASEDYQLTIRKPFAFIDLTVGDSAESTGGLNQDSENDENTSDTHGKDPNSPKDKK